MLQFITNASSHDEIIAQVRKVIAGGCRWVQLRMKDSERNDIVAVARELKPICAEHECILVIDDHVDIAQELELDGVHLGKADMPPMQARAILGGKPIIGVTANTFSDILSYSGMDIDYIGLGPFRFTSTKKNLSPILGLDGYRSIMQQCVAEGIFIPTVAIGGITEADIDDVMATGVSGIALSGAIVNAPDPTATTSAVIARLNDIVARRLQK
ncbi:MAG: thiamine phosphate synthase [Muribaculaceae bacterium]|nr:thiamine phosphate synthase [Muribaculaceae bacterium]